MNAPPSHALNEVAAKAAVEVWQDSIVSPEESERRVLGSSSTPTTGDAVVRGDEVLLDDLVVPFR